MNTFGLQLSKPRIVMTRHGERTVQSAPPTPEFWDAWKANKSELKKAGWAVGKDQRTDEWQVTLWKTTMSSEARAEARSMSSAATAADVTIPRPAGLVDDYLPYQKAGISYATRQIATLIADEPGLGKTIQAIGIANVTKPDRILVICPVVAKGVWLREIPKWQTLDLPIYSIKNGKDTFPVVSHGWVVINYDLVSKFETEIKLQQWDLIIIDEAHYLKNRGAQRTKRIFGGKEKYKDDAGNTKERSFEQIPATRKLCLTGTPILNRPIELFTVLHYLDPQRWPSWYNYAKRYAGGHNDGWGFKSDGATNLPELQARLRETIMVRRLKKDVLKELPPKRWQVIPIEPDAACAQIIARELEIEETKQAEMAAANAAALQAEVDGDELAYRDAVKRLKGAQQAAFTQTSLIRHEVGLAKVGNVCEHLDNIEDGKVIVFAHHRDVVAKLAEHLSDRGVVTVTGETKAEDRTAAEVAFQTDPKVRFFIGNIQACGVAITLHASSHVVFAEQDWTPGKMTQAEDRAHRIGQHDSLLIQHIVLEGSLDAHIAQTQVGKAIVVEAALDGAMKTDFEAVIAEGDVLQDVNNAAQDARRAKVDELAATLTPAQIRAIHDALKVVAGMDIDHARDQNGVGFSKLDTMFGCDLAGKISLTPRQAAVGMRLARKYRRQYDEALYNQIFSQEERV